MAFAPYLRGIIVLNDAIGTTVGCRQGGVSSGVAFNRGSTIVTKGGLVSGIY